MRGASLGDCEAICRIYNAAIVERGSTFETEPRFAGDFSERVGGGRFPLLVADAGDGVVGWAGLSPYSARPCYAGIGECSVSRPASDWSNVAASHRSDCTVATDDSTALGGMSWSWSGCWVRRRTLPRMADGAGEWGDPERVTEYLSREIPHRLLAEEMLLAALPARVERFIDLGTGDGRLLAAVHECHPEATAVGFDVSEPMLAQAAQRFDGDPLVELRRHDLGVPLEDVGPADVVASGLAIHHLEDDRSR